MANHQSAKKRIRSNEKKRIRNKASLSEMRTLIKKVHDSENKADAESNFKNAVSYIDKISRKNRMHSNTAARKKSSLAKFVNRLEK